MRTNIGISGNVKSVTSNDSCAFIYKWELEGGWNIIRALLNKLEMETTIIICYLFSLFHDSDKFCNFFPIFPGDPGDCCPAFTSAARSANTMNIFFYVVREIIIQNMPKQQ